MTHSPWFEELRYQFERRGLSLLLKETVGPVWVATAWDQRASIRDVNTPVGSAEGATPREASLRLLMILDDGSADGR